MKYEWLFTSVQLLQPIHALISKDEEIKKIQTSVNAGMSTNASHLQSYLGTWDRYDCF